MTAPACSTPFRSVGFADPKESAAVVAFLASAAAGYITGATIDVNGGRFML
jgi:NAD(P)-dependent dehydrogenase (short-subunit alcohol dehydrogenase family)